MSQLAELVSTGQVLMHSMIIGELACGNLSHRQKRLMDWRRFPMISEASHQEVLSAIESRQLMGRGIGFVDAHLLCAVLNREGTLLWTRDNRLNRIAGDMGIAFSESI
jgi:predicted nucleic acid-binding protein